MDDSARIRFPLGPCVECGRALPEGTIRYCVHCGAEVVGEPTSWSRGEPSPGQPTTWWTGEYRAPSPLDQVPPPQALPLPLPTSGPDLPPAPGVPHAAAHRSPAAAGWFDDDWYRDVPPGRDVPPDADVLPTAAPIPSPPPSATEAVRAWSPPPPHPVERHRAPLLPVVAAVVGLVMIIATGLVWLNLRASGGTAAGVSAGISVRTPAATGAASSGADGPSAGVSSSVPAVGLLTAMDALLDRSTAARGDVASTALRLQSCRVSAATAAATFRRAGADRARLASEATALSVGGTAQVDDAGDAVRAFIALQRASADADDAFAAWADEIAVIGCRGRARPTVNWESANRHSAQASSAKARFVRLWNPIAALHGLRPRSAEAI